MLIVGSFASTIVGRNLYVSIVDYFTKGGSSSYLLGELFVIAIGCFFVFVLGIGFGRFFLRAIPPDLSQQTTMSPRKLVAALAALAVLPAFLLVDFVVSLLQVAGESPQHHVPIAPSSMVYGSFACSAPIAILWAIGAIGPLLLRQLRPRSFLNRPFVLFLRRFSSFSDRSVIALVLRQAKAGMPVVFLTPTMSKVRDWDPFIVAFAGLKLWHPWRSIPIVLRARDSDWHNVADELIRRAYLILIDTSEGSEALHTETQMIQNADRWSRTLCLSYIKNKSERLSDYLGIPRECRCVRYSKSWTGAIPRLALSCPIVWFAVNLLWLPLGALGYLTGLSKTQLLVLAFCQAVTYLIAWSMFWRPAINRRAKTELKLALRKAGRPFFQQTLSDNAPALASTPGWSLRRSLLFVAGSVVLLGIILIASYKLMTLSEERTVTRHGVALDYTLRIPAFWNIPVDADNFDLRADWRGCYIGVIAEKQSLDPAVATEWVKKNLSRSASDVQISDHLPAVINGRKWMNFTVTSTIPEGGRLAHEFYVYSGPEGTYQLIAWTQREVFDGQIERARSVLRTFTFPPSTGGGNNVASGTWKQIVARDGSCSLRIPPDWKEELPTGDVTLLVHGSVLWIAAVGEEYNVGSPGLLESIIRNKLENQGATFESDRAEELELDGHRWLRFVATFTNDDPALTHQFYVYAGTEGSYQVIGWTARDSFDANKAKLRQIMQTFEICR